MIMVMYMYMFTNLTINNDIIFKQIITQQFLQQLLIKPQKPPNTDKTLDQYQNIPQLQSPHSPNQPKQHTQPKLTIQLMLLSAKQKIYNLQQYISELERDRKEKDIKNEKIREEIERVREDNRRIIQMIDVGKGADCMGKHVQGIAGITSIVQSIYINPTTHKAPNNNPPHPPHPPHPKPNPQQLTQAQTQIATLKQQITNLQTMKASLADQLSQMDKKVRANDLQLRKGQSYVRQLEGEVQAIKNKQEGVKVGGIDAIGVQISFAGHDYKYVQIGGSSNTVETPTPSKPKSPPLTFTSLQSPQSQKKPRPRQKQNKNHNLNQVTNINQKSGIKSHRQPLKEKKSFAQLQQTLSQKKSPNIHICESFQTKFGS